jgi:Mn-dependent DtxR family transcriptional regulator
MGIHESGEMYLESIHVLLEKKGSVRSVDVSEYMGYSKPSISRAMGVLRRDGYISVDKNGYITLTEAGLRLANKIYERHTLLSNMLERIGVSKETAAEDACRLEHAISDESFEAIKRYMESQK